MPRKLTTLFLLMNVLLAEGSAWAADSGKPAKTSVNNVRAMQQQSEQRLEVLNKLAAQQMAPAGVKDAHASPAAEAGLFEQPSVSSTRRSDEASFASMPAAEQGQTARTFAALRAEVEQVDSPDYRLNAYQQFVQQHPAHRDARLHLARELMLNDQPEQVLVVLAPLTAAGQKRTHPDWQPWFWLGSAYLSKNEPVKARSALEVALSKEQDIPEIWVHLAIAEQAMDNHAGALQYLEIAERLAPRLAQVHLNKAYSYERRGDLQQARTSYQKFLIGEGSVVTSSTRPAIVRHLEMLALDT